jgi:hypothetical protein
MIMENSQPEIELFKASQEDQGPGPRMQSSTNCDGDWLSVHIQV